MAPAPITSGHSLPMSKWTAWPWDRGVVGPRRKRSRAQRSRPWRDSSQTLGDETLLPGPEIQVPQSHHHRDGGHDEALGDDEDHETQPCPETDVAGTDDGKGHELNELGSKRPEETDEQQEPDRWPPSAAH